jgi:uncharacterized membrane protein YagU involved in acid resistance
LPTPIRVHPDPPAGTDEPSDQIRGVSQRPPWPTVAVAGLLAGALDLIFAFIFYGRQGVSPPAILRGIASGVLGHGAFSMGPWTIALGAALHFFIAVCAAFIFYLASRRLTVLTRRPLLCGAIFGLAVYIAMHFMVLPLSRVHYRLPALTDVVGELFSHIFLFGMVIALGVARASATAHGTRNLRA